MKVIKNKIETVTCNYMGDLILQNKVFWSLLIWMPDEVLTECFNSVLL